MRYENYFICRLHFILFYFILFYFISWRLITSQHFSGFFHTLTWISHGVTRIPHPDPPSHLPRHPIPLGLPSAPGPIGFILIHTSVQVILTTEGMCYFSNVYLNLTRSVQIVEVMEFLKGVCVCVCVCVHTSPKQTW